MTHLARIMKNEMEPFDLLFRNFFDPNAFFMPAEKLQLKYPVDIYEDLTSVNIEIAVAGIDKKDIQISEENGILKVSYDKNEEDSDSDNEKHYIQKIIAKRAFNFGWKVSDKFDLKKIDATMEKGILKISIPKVEEIEKPKKMIEIK
jgi:HSP20 family protein